MSASYIWTANSCTHWCGPLTKIVINPFNCTRHPSFLPLQFSVFLPSKTFLIFNRKWKFAVKLLRRLIDWLTNYPPSPQKKCLQNIRQPIRIECFSIATADKIISHIRSVFSYKACGCNSLILVEKLGQETTKNFIWDVIGTSWVRTKNQVDRYCFDGSALNGMKN
jgi:hypothetical protein